MKPTARSGKANMCLIHLLFRSVGKNEPIVTLIVNAPLHRAIRKVFTPGRTDTQLEMPSLINANNFSLFPVKLKSKKKNTTAL
jgi:hypothetical protein